MPGTGPGVTMRPLSADELKDVNTRIEDPSWQVPADAVCLVPNLIEGGEDEPRGPREDPMRGLGLMPTTPSASLEGASVDTTVLLGSAPLALPLPVLPHVTNGERLRAKRSKEDVAQALAEQPSSWTKHPDPSTFSASARDGAGMDEPALCGWSGHRPRRPPADGPCIAGSLAGAPDLDVR